jgi:hypothetical protein
MGLQESRASLARMGRQDNLATMGHQGQQEPELRGLRASKGLQERTGPMVPKDRLEAWVRKV